MLSYARLIQRFYIRHNFKINDFTTEDYRTMCHLLRQRYLIHNEDIKVFKDIKLIDENNKLVGIYPASQARKKAYSMKKDITLLNSDSDPVVCKVIAFRNDLLNKFFDQIVYKHNEKLLSRANSTKQLKIALNLNNNQLKVKAKQIIQLSKKNINVRVYMTCKQDTKDECLQKLQFVKSQVQGKCIIDKDIRNYRDDQQSEEQSKNYTQTYSFTCKSRQNQFLQMLKQSSQKAPDDAIHNFLKKYYKQDDVDMLDLKVTGQTISENVNDIQVINKAVQKKVVQQKSRSKGKGVWKDQQPDQDNVIQRQAKARILNQRLKVLLGWTS